MGIATKPLSSLPDTEQSFSDLLDRHKRHIGYVGVAILLVAGGTWFAIRSKAIKERNAERAYRGAIQSVYAGNAQLAESDLRKVVARYNGTMAGRISALALARLYYDEGKYQQGLDILGKAASDADDMAYDLHTLRAAGFEGLKRPADAAKEYEAAAAGSRFDGDREQAQANAARAYAEAGNKAVAIRLWSEILKKPESQLALEARVRLGELQAAPIKP